MFEAAYKIRPAEEKDEVYGLYLENLHQVKYNQHQC